MSDQDKINRKFVNACYSNKLETAKAAMGDQGRAFWDERRLPGAQVNGRDGRGRTGLMYACEYGHGEVFDFLLQNNADVKLADKEGSTALMFAAYSGHMGMIDDLLVKKVDLETRNDQGESALMFAAKNGKTSALGHMIAKGADVNASDYKGFTVLMHAVQRSDLATIEILIRSNVDTNAVNDKGENALFIAALIGNTGVMDALLQAGIDTQRRNNDSKKAEEVAMSGTISKMIRNSDQSQKTVARTGAVAVAMDAPVAIIPPTPPPSAERNEVLRKAMEDEGLDPALSEQWVSIGDVAIEHVVGSAASPKFLSDTFNFASGQYISAQKNLLTGQVSSVVNGALSQFPNQQHVAQAYQQLLDMGKNPPEYAGAPARSRSLKL